MATALAKGWVKSRWTPADCIAGTDVLSEARVEFTKATACRTLGSVAEVMADSDVLVLAVKPQHMAGVMEDMRARLTDRHLIVSIAAGVTLAKMSQSLGEHRRLVRVMPNTPALVGAGASAFALGGTATAEDAKLAQAMLSTVGVAVQVPENLLDAVTGLSGSGPAYVYQIIEALSDGGVRVGLPRAIATQLAAQTVLGAAKMVLETGEHPGRSKMPSPVPAARPSPVCTPWKPAASEAISSTPSSPPPSASANWASNRRGRPIGAAHEVSGHN